MNKQNIPNLYVCSMDYSESKMVNIEETLLHVCSMDNSKSEIIIFKLMFYRRELIKKVSVGRYPTIKLGARKLGSKRIIRVIDGRRKVMRTQ